MERIAKAMHDPIAPPLRAPPGAIRMAQSRSVVPTWTGRLLRAGPAATRTERRSEWASSARLCAARPLPQLSSPLRCICSSLCCVLARSRTMAFRCHTLPVPAPGALLHSRFPSSRGIGLARIRASVDVPRLSCGVPRHLKTGARLVAVRAAKDVRVDLKEAGVSGDILPSGEWAENFSLLNYEDLSKHYEPALFKPEAQPDTILAEVMSKILYIAFPDQALQEVDRHFAEISGIPVVDDDHRCVGVLSRKDRSQASDLKAKVKDVMSSPAITLSADKTVSDAAVLMLKNKIHRIPVVNDEMQVVGIVTRTDIFTALEGGA